MVRLTVDNGCATNGKMSLKASISRDYTDLFKMKKNVKIFQNEKTGFEMKFESRIFSPQMKERKDENCKCV